MDDIAWTLNLRGTDVPCNPVFVSYLLIESDKVSLFVDDNKLSPEVKQYLQDNQVSLYKYNKVEKCLESYSEYNILLDGNETSYYLWKAVKCQEIVAAGSPIPAMKAVKNKANKQQRRHRNLLAERHEPLSGYQPSPQIAHDDARQSYLYDVLQEDAKNILHLRPVHLPDCNLLATYLIWKLLQPSANIWPTCTKNYLRRIQSVLRSANGRILRRRNLHLSNMRLWSGGDLIQVSWAR